MTDLIATANFHYGPLGKHDAEAPLIKRGESFAPVPTFTMSEAEAARSLINSGSAMTPEQWAKRKPQADANFAWAAAETEAENAALEIRRAAKRKPA